MADNPFAQLLIMKLQRLGGSRKMITTIQLVVELGGASDRTIRWYLQRMEQNGIVKRPDGRPKSGWMLAREVLQ